MERWICSDHPEHVFTSAGTGMCPIDGGILMKSEAGHPDSELGPVDVLEGTHGLGVLVFDLSYSMGLEFDPESGNPAKKIDIVAEAFASTIAALTFGSDAMIAPQNYFLGLIGFSDTAGVLSTYQLSEMGYADFDSTKKHWSTYIRTEHTKYNGGTNITAGLRIAREICNEARSGRLESSTHFQKLLSDRSFALGSQHVLDRARREVVPVPNIRVLVYSDGDQTVGDFQNVFSDFELVPGLRSAEGRPVNGVMSIFFGKPVGDKEKHAKLMQEVAGFCPEHEMTGYIPIGELKHYEKLRHLLHLTSSASGFCLSCAPV